MVNPPKITYFKKPKNRVAMLLCGSNWGTFDSEQGSLIIILRQTDSNNECPRRSGG